MIPAYAIDLAPYLYILGASLAISLVLLWWMHR